MYHQHIYSHLLCYNTTYNYVCIYAPISAPSSVQNATVTLVGNTINITWSPASITNGMILQYIVQRINSSGKSYYYISGNKNYLELPYFHDALIFIAAVNQYGQSNYKQAKSSGKKSITVIVHRLYSSNVIQLLVCHLPVLIMEHVLPWILMVIIVLVLDVSLENFVNTHNRSVQKCC